LRSYTKKKEKKIKLNRQKEKEIQKNTTREKEKRTRRQIKKNLTKLTLHANGLNFLNIETQNKSTHETIKIQLAYQPTKQADEQTLRGFS
jgi:hypothetical protein